VQRAAQPVRPVSVAQLGQAPALLALLVHSALVEHLRVLVSAQLERLRVVRHVLCVQLVTLAPLQVEAARLVLLISTVLLAPALAQIVLPVL